MSYAAIACRQQGITNNIRIVQRETDRDGRVWKRVLRPFRNVEEAQKEADFRNEVIKDPSLKWVVEQ